MGNIRIRTQGQERKKWAKTLGPSLPGMHSSHKRHVKRKPLPGSRVKKAARNVEVARKAPVADQPTPLSIVKSRLWNLLRAYGLYGNEVQKLPSDARVIYAQLLKEKQMLERRKQTRERRAQQAKQAK